MMKTLVFVSVLCCAAWVCAQTTDNGQTSSGSQMGTTTNSTSSNQSGAQSGSANSSEQTGDIKIRGCLKQGNGDFEITDPQTGTSYSLIGNSLGNYVGRDVEVMGKPTGTSGQTASSPSQTKTVGQSASENPFQVHNIRSMGECSGSTQHP